MLRKKQGEEEENTMAVQLTRYTTPYLLTNCGVQPREPFVPHQHPQALPPIQEIEVQTPIGTNLSDSKVGELVEQWVDVFHMHWQYMTARVTYIHTQPLNVPLTLDSVDTSTPIGETLRKAWTQFIAMKDAWIMHENGGFAIRRYK